MNPDCDSDELGEIDEQELELMAYEKTLETCELRRQKISAVCYTTDCFIQSGENAYSTVDWSVRGCEDDTIT